MEALYSHEAARLVAGLEHKDYLMVSGRVQALENVYHLIETLDTAERQINEHKRSSRDTEATARTQRDLAFAGSPWFDIARKG